MLALVFLGWLAWTAVGHTRPQVTSELDGFEVVDDSHRPAVARWSSLADDDVEATCRLRAFAEDHTIVGELAFTPTRTPGAARSTRSAPSGRPRPSSRWAAPRHGRSRRPLTRGAC